MDTHAIGPIPPREAFSSGALVTRARPGLSGLGGQRRHDQQARHGGGVSGQRGNKADMASGINSTFRQIGIAAGIALLGTLFSSQVNSQVLARVAAVPELARRGPQIATAPRLSLYAPERRQR